MSKESYPRKLGRQVKQSYDAQKENRAILNDPNLTAEQKRERYAAAEELRKAKYSRNIDRLSKPVDSYLDNQMENGSQIEPFGQDLDQSTTVDTTEMEQQGDSKHTDEMRKLKNFQEEEGGKPKFQEGGGKSQEAKTPSSTKRSGAVDGIADEARQGLKGEATQAAKQTVNKAVNAAKKAAAQAVKKLAMALARNPYFWIVVGCLILAVIIFVLIYGMYAGMANQSPNPRGGSLVRVTDPIADKNWIQKLLQFSGDKDVQTKITQEILEGLKIDLASLENDSTVSPDIKAKIAAANEAINQFNPGAPDKTKALAIVAAIKEVINSYWYVAPLSNNIPTQSPFVDTNSMHFNLHAHVGTPAFPCGPNTDNPTCDKVKDHPARTYQGFPHDKSNPPNNCDAVDLSGYAVGTPVYPDFSGEVKMDSESSGIWIENSNGDTAVYAHLKKDDSIHVGTKVDINTYKPNGKSIGTIQTLPKGMPPHLHLELFNKDKHCIVVSPAEAATKDGQMGSFLWSKMKTFLHL